MFDITKYSPATGFILEKKNEKVSITYSKYDPMTGAKLQTVKESLDMNQILAQINILQNKLDCLNALLADINEIEEV